MLIISFPIFLALVSEVVFHLVPSFGEDGAYLMVGDASGNPGNFSDSDKVFADNAGCKYMDVEDFIALYGKQILK